MTFELFLLYYIRKRSNKLDKKTAEERDVISNEKLAKKYSLNLVPSKTIEGIKCETVEGVVDKDHLKTINNIVKFLTKSSALGIAAPQFGINEKFFGAKLSTGIQIVFNPKYIKAGSVEKSYEGCLSYAGKTFIVKRFKAITAMYQTYNVDTERFENVRTKLTGLDAKVFQHETDHLNGRTINTIQVKSKNGGYNDK